MLCLCPGKLRGILWLHFPGLLSPGKRLQVLESPGNLLNSSNKVYRIFAVRNE